MRCRSTIWPCEGAPITLTGDEGEEGEEDDTVPLDLAQPQAEDDLGVTIEGGEESP